MTEEALQIFASRLTRITTQDLEILLRHSSIIYEDAVSLIKSELKERGRL